MTLDTGVTKEEDDDEDDTMQNTVVLFSNTDKFVLLQVHLFDISVYFMCLKCSELGSVSFKCSVNGL